jgi:hypothetical protein
LEVEPVADKMSVEEAAKKMGVSPIFLRLGLRHEEFPFGKANVPAKSFPMNLLCFTPLTTECSKHHLLALFSSCKTPDVNTKFLIVEKGVQMVSGAPGS